MLIGGDTVVDIGNYEYAPHGLLDNTDYGRADLVPGQSVEIDVVPDEAHGDRVVMLTEKD